jgi:hypothetical protein
LLARFVRHLLQPCHAADRQERDVSGGHTEVPSGQCVAELVQHNGRKHRQDEHGAAHHRRDTLSAHEAADGQKRDQKEEGTV